MFIDVQHGYPPLLFFLEYHIEIKNVKKIRKIIIFLRKNMKVSTTLTKSKLKIWL